MNNIWCFNKINNITKKDIKITTPKVTCKPWKLVSVKELDPNKLPCKVTPCSTKTVNSKYCPPRKIQPKIEVASNHILNLVWSPLCIAPSAKTIVKLLIKRTNALTEVYGILNTS